MTLLYPPELKSKNGILRNYESGDLLSILPEGESLERDYILCLFSRKNNTVLPSVKKHEHGVCSTQLSNLEIGERIKVSFKRNDHFHLPRDAPGAILVSNGTGMAPYLGMIADSPRAQEPIVFWGGQNRNSFKLYEQTLQKSKQENLTIHTAYSREQEHKLYVQDILEQHMDYVREALDKKYILMLCGGLSMQKVGRRCPKQALSQKRVCF